MLRAQLRNAAAHNHAADQTTNATESVHSCKQIKKLSNRWTRWAVSVYRVSDSRLSSRVSLESRVSSSCVCVVLSHDFHLRALLAFFLAQARVGEIHLSKKSPQPTIVAEDKTTKDRSVRQCGFNHTALEGKVDLVITNLGPCSAPAHGGGRRGLVADMSELQDGPLLHCGVQARGLGKVHAPVLPAIQSHSWSEFASATSLHGGERFRSAAFGGSRGDEREQGNEQRVKSNGPTPLSTTARFAIACGAVLCEAG